MSEWLLTQIINYGDPILGAIVFLGALGIPFPGTHYCDRGRRLLQAGILILAHNRVYSADLRCPGRLPELRHGILRSRTGAARFRGSDKWIQAENSFQRWGGMSILLTRFLITAIAVPVNLIAGTGNFPFRRFLLYDLAGEAIWIFGLRGSGLFIRSTMGNGRPFLTNMSGLLLGLLLLGVGIWWDYEDSG